MTSSNTNESVPPSFAVACPHCEYLLHATNGPVVTCSECGERSDVEELAERYRRRWSVTPVYERMIRPVLIALMLVIAVPVLGVVAAYGFGGAWPLGGMLLVLLIGVLVMTWLALALLAVRGLALGQGWKLLMVLHAAMVGYFVCGLGVFAGLIGLAMLPVAILNAAADRQAVFACAVVTFIGVLCAVMFRPLWKLDRYVGRTCVRHALHEWACEGSSGDPMPVRR